MIVNRDVRLRNDLKIANSTTVPRVEPKQRSNIYRIGHRMC